MIRNNSDSFESPKSYLFVHYLKKQLSTFKVRNLVLKTTNLLHKHGFDDSQLSATVMSLSQEGLEPINSNF